VIAPPLVDARAHAYIAPRKRSGELIISVASPKTTSARAETGEILDVLGPRIQFLTALSDNDEDYCLIKGVVPAGMVVPVHSHAERETFYVLEGEIQGLCEDRWVALGLGDVFDAPGGLKHAWRNPSGAPASLLLATPMRLGRFFRDIGRPVPTVELGAPRQADMQRLAEIAHAYGYWLGSPAVNAAAGISFGGG
jgi:quercetin dioxygenase-like cupin family protein